MIFGIRKKNKTKFNEALKEVIEKSFAGSNNKFALYMGVKIRTVEFWLKGDHRPRLRYYPKFKKLGICWQIIYDNGDKNG